jgi:uncharacterized protein YjlB
MGVFECIKKMQKMLNSTTKHLLNRWHRFLSAFFMETLTYFLKDNGVFPNSKLPVIHYKNGIDIPFFRPAHAVEKLFSENGWTNNWDAGIYTYHHYHSITHEAIGVYKGKAVILLGGENGKLIVIQKGDVLIIPAGVAHKNVGKEEDVMCVGGYPGGADFDMNYGQPGERPKTDKQIAALPVPESDPLMGVGEGVAETWKAYMPAPQSVHQQTS